MRLSLILTVMMCAQNLFALDCVDTDGKDILNQPEVFTAIIEKSKSCYDAKQMAEACAWGSSLDVSTAGTAYSICEAELKSQKPTNKLSQLLIKMKDSCTAKYKNESGTLYRSMNAYCHLSAIEWVVNLATPN